MSKNKPIPASILELIDRAAAHVGKYEQENASQNYFCMCAEEDLGSPIEMAFYVAFYAVARINYYEMAEPVDCKTMGPGLHITPQHKIGKYRADFFVTEYNYKGEVSTRNVVVECDGTAFHERTEPERRAEKLRDRYMQKLDLKVFRYTGKELLEDPYSIAAEVISYVTGRDDIQTPEQYFS